MKALKIDRWTLNAILGEAELEPDEVVRDGYSGRGMYGKVAGLALSLEGPSQLYRFLVAAGRVDANIQHGAEGDSFDPLWLADYVETDDLGRGMIAYWRNAEITDL